MKNFIINKFFILLSLILFSCSDKSEEKTTINIWHQMPYSQREIFQTICTQYEKENPEIKIQILYRETEELRSSFQSAAMGGSGPELIYGPSDQVGPFSTMKIIQPLNNLLEPEFINQFESNALIKYNSKLWMIGDVIGNHIMLIYNKDLIQNPPKNTNELIEIGKSFNKDFDSDGKIDQYGLVWNYTEPFFYVPWINGFGNEWIINDNIPNLNTQSNIEAFKFISSLRDVHKIVPQECDYETANAMFKTGKAAMIINGDWSWGDYKDIINFGITRLPMVSETNRWPSPLIGAKGYSININTKDEKLLETIKLLKYLLSKDVQLIYTENLNTQPSNKLALKSELIKNNELLKESSKIIAVGKPMPIAPEMRAVWDALRTEYQSVLGGIKTADEAAKSAQLNSIKNINNMNEVLKSDYSLTVLKLIILILLIILIIKLKGLIKITYNDIKKDSFSYIILFPSIFIVAIVVLYPFLYNLAISFSNFSLKTFNNWELIGLHHYINVLSSTIFYSVLFKTVLWTSINIIFHVSIGVFLAILINRTLPLKPIIRTLLIIPWAVPQYISALTWRGMFNQEYGSINLVLNKLFGMSPIQWLNQPLEAFSACILTNVWLGFPFMMVIALGGLQAIPQELYDAAKIDGANRWQQFKNITIPMLLPVMIPAIVLGTIWTFNNINVVWLVSNAGEPSDQTHILVSYVYKNAFNLYRYGYSSALSIIIFLLLLIFGINFMKKTNATKSVY